MCGDRVLFLVLIKVPRIRELDRRSVGKKGFVGDPKPFLMMARKS